MMQVEVKTDPLKEDLARLNNATRRIPRTAETEPEKDPKLKVVKELQRDLDYLIKLHRAPIEEKINLAQERIKSLDDNAPDYVVRLRKENEILQNAVNNTFSDEKLTRLDEALAKLKKSDIAAKTILGEAYSSLKAGDKSVANDKFKLADEHLEKAVKSMHELAK